MTIGLFLGLIADKFVIGTACDVLHSRDDGVQLCGHTPVRAVCWIGDRPAHHRNLPAACGCRERCHRV